MALVCCGHNAYRAAAEVAALVPVAFLVVIGRPGRPRDKLNGLAAASHVNLAGVGPARLTGPLAAGAVAQPLERVVRENSGFSCLAGYGSSTSDLNGKRGIRSRGGAVWVESSSTCDPFAK